MDKMENKNKTIRKSVWLLRTISNATFSSNTNVSGIFTITGANEIMTLPSITLPTCLNKALNGSIGRNSTDLWYCDNTGIWADIIKE